MSGCDNSLVEITNMVTNVTGHQQSITIVAAGPKTDGGTLTFPASTPQPPIDLAYGKTLTLTVGSADGSNGWARGYVSITVPDGTVKCEYYMQPGGLFNSNCTAGGKPVEVPIGYTVTPTTNGSTAEGNNCWVKFTISR